MLFGNLWLINKNVWNGSDIMKLDFIELSDKEKKALITLGLQISVIVLAVITLSILAWLRVW